MPAIMQEEAPEDLGDGEDKLPVRNGPEHLPAEPLAQLHAAFLPTARAEFSFFTRERQEPFRAARSATNPGKTLMELPTGQAPDHDLFQIVLGKAAAYFALYVVHCFFYFGILSRVYHLPQRADPGTLILFLLPFLIAIILMGLGLSNFFKHRETAMQALLFMSIPAIFLSGFAWPPEATPKWLRVLSYLLPSTAGISGFLRVNQMGASLQEVRFEWLVLWILCALYLSLAWGSVRRNRTCFARRS